ncbi:MAG TPA: hypothetical protein VM581_02085, partial [Magnetospirillaceae bacterium]|nr:hypothetical protein [Magnetospirillaceae bacterium]
MLRYLTKLSYQLRDLVDYLAAFRKDEHSNFRVEEVVSDDYLGAAKKLHAKVYLSRGFVSEKDVVDGLLTHHADPHQKHSRYFVVIDLKTSRVVATARQIELKQGYGHNSFAIVKQANLYERARRMVRKHDPAKTIEISGLAKESGVSKIAPLLLYRAMWHHSLRSEHTLWLLACDVRLFIRLKLLFGAGISKIGRVTPYYGGDIVPAVLDVQNSVTNLKKALERANSFEKPLRRRIVRFMLNGIPAKHLNSRERDAL